MYACHFYVDQVAQSLEVRQNMMAAASNETARRTACLPPTLLTRPDVQLGIVQIHDSCWVHVAVTPDEEWIRIPNRRLQQHIPVELTLEAFVTRIFEYFSGRANTVIPWRADAWSALSVCLAQESGEARDDVSATIRQSGRAHSQNFAQHVSILSALMAIVDLGAGVFDECRNEDGWTLAVELQHVRRAQAFYGLTSIVEDALSLVAANAAHGNPWPDGHDHVAVDVEQKCQATAEGLSDCSSTGMAASYSCSEGEERCRPVGERAKPPQSQPDHVLLGAANRSHDQCKPLRLSAHARADDDFLRTATRNAAGKRRFKSAEIVVPTGTGTHLHENALRSTATVDTLFANMVLRCPHFFNRSLLGTRSCFLARRSDCTPEIKRDLITAALSHGETLGVWTAHLVPGRKQWLYVRATMTALPNFHTVVLPELGRLGVNVQKAILAEKDQKIRHHSLRALVTWYLNPQVFGGAGLSQRSSTL